MKVSAQATVEKLIRCISNTGVKIPVGEGDRIFDKFHRAFVGEYALDC